MIDTNRTRILAVLLTWCMVGSLTMGTLALVGSNASAGAFSGTISDGQTLKYDISVTSTLWPITVMVYWTTPGNDIDLYLRNPEGVLVGSSESITGYEETLIYSPPSTGTYVLEVYGADISSSTSISFTGSCLYHQISLQTSSGSLLWVLIIAVIVIIVVVLLVILLLVVRRKPVSQFPPPAYGAQQPVQQYPYQQPPQQYQYQPPAQQYAPAQTPQSPQAQQASRSCPYCSTALDPTWLVCPKCGARIGP